MPVDALKELLRKAKVTFNKKERKHDLIEKALQSQEALAIVEEEARAQGEHIDGAKVDVETVEGSFVNVDSSMFPQETSTTGTGQTSLVRRSQI